MLSQLNLMQGKDIVSKIVFPKLYISSQIYVSENTEI